jgi:acyl-homoserine lactone acylase PvdQ
MIGCVSGVAFEKELLSNGPRSYSRDRNYLPCLQAAKASEITRWKQETQRVTIIRNDWAIAHVKGKVDADAVFGMNYTQPRMTSIASRRTTSADEYLETVQKQGDRFYKYGNEERPLKTEQVSIPYKTNQGMVKRKFIVDRTEHRPIICEENRKWVSIRLMQNSVKALMQPYARTKANFYRSELQGHIECEYHP